MIAGQLDLRIGSRVWWRGDSWTVSSLADGAFHLTAGDRVATVSVIDLADAVITDPPPADVGDGTETSAMVLSRLSTKDRAAVERLYRNRWLGSQQSEEVLLLEPVSAYCRRACREGEGIAGESR